MIVGSVRIINNHQRRKTHYINPVIVSASLQPCTATPYKTIKSLSICIISALLIIQISIPSITFGDDKPTYTVPGRCNKYVDEIEKYSWPTPLVIQIMKLESGCDPYNDNLKDHHDSCDGSYNALQISCEHYKKGEDKHDMALAIYKAYQLYVRRGDSFGDWSTCEKIINCS